VLAHAFLKFTIIFNHDNIEFVYNVVIAGSSQELLRHKFIKNFLPYKVECVNSIAAGKLTKNKFFLTCRTTANNIILLSLV